MYVIADYQSDSPLPTKPFGVPYPLVVVYENKTKCILADTPEELMVAWVPDFLEQTDFERENTLFNLAVSVVSQIQAAILEKQNKKTLLSLTEEEKEVFEWDYEDELPIESWDKDFSLILVDSPCIGDFAGDNVKRFYAGTVEDFIKSLNQFDLVDIGFGDFSYQRSMPPLMLNR